MASCLSLLAAATTFSHLRQIHAHLVTSGHLPHLAPHLLRRLLALSPAHLPVAHRLFLSLPSPPLPLYNLLLPPISSSSRPLAAAELFVLLRRRGLRPDCHTLPYLFKSLARLGATSLSLTSSAHADAVKNGLAAAVVYVQNALMAAYSACCLLTRAIQVFGEMPRRTLVSWNTALTACADNSRNERCVGLFLEMVDSGFEPDQTSFVVLLSAAAELGNLGLGKWVHGQVLSRRLDMTVHLGTSLVNMYAKCGAIRYGRRLFDSMAARNVWTWSAMILGLAQHGSAGEALKLFERMKAASVAPNCVTFLGVLCACSHAGLVDNGRQFFREMQHVYGIRPMMTHYGAMVDVLGRNGRLREAYKFVLDMPVAADPVVWRTLLSACQLRASEDSMDIAEDVQARLLDLEPGRCGNYVIVANIYSEVGSWDEAAKVRRTMREGGMKKMAGESCIEVWGRVHRFISGDDSCHDFERICRVLDELNSNMRKCESVDRIFLTDTNL